MDTLILTLDRIIALGTKEQMYFEEVCLVQWYYDYAHAFRVPDPDDGIWVNCHRQINPEYVYDRKGLAPDVLLARASIRAVYDLYRNYSVAHRRETLSDYQQVIADRGMNFIDRSDHDWLL